MPNEDADRQFRLVQKAIGLVNVTGCFEFDARTNDKVRNDEFFAGLEPKELKRLAAAHVSCGGRIKQKKDTDEEWEGRRRFDYLHSICFSIPDLGRVFMKIVLVKPDEDYPEARIVSAHESIR